MTESERILILMARDLTATARRLAEALEHKNAILDELMEISRKQRREDDWWKLGADPE